MKANMTETVAAWRDHLNDGVLPPPRPAWRVTGWLGRDPGFDAAVAPYLRRRVAGILAP
jgi:hypothetical protein